MYQRFALLLLCLLAFPAFALEGGYTSTHGDWKNAKPHDKPDQATRAAEQAARTEAIQAEIARLEERLKRVPDAGKMEELHGKLKVIYKDYGWEPKSQLVYGRRCLDPMFKNQDRLPEKLLKAFVQLNEDCKARDIDLIILPLVPTPHFHAHTLVDGIDATHEYYPGWTKMMIQMLEADLEVVDSVEEFRAEAENPVLVSWSNDFHTGSLGRQLAAKKLAERLQRYDFARELKSKGAKWNATEKDKKGASFPQRITTVNKALVSEKSWKRANKGKTWPPAGAEIFKGKRQSMLAEDAPQDMPSKLRNFTFKYLQLQRPGNAAELRRTDLVMIGDSQLHSAVYGSGLPEFIMSEVGGVFRWGSKSWSGFSPPDIYREVVPDGAIQPRVLVLAFLPKYFWHVYDRGGKPDEGKCKHAPRPMPAVGGVAKGPALPKKEFTATVKIGKVSQKPKKDPSELDYDEALMQVSATIADGPHKGTEIGLRYWILYKSEWTKADGAIKPGQTLKLTLHDWHQVIIKEGKLKEHMIFNTIGQGTSTPVFWVTKGSVAPDQVLK